MVQVAPEEGFAPFVVGLGVDDVEMPGLIHGFAGRYLAAGDRGEDEESGVFPRDALGVGAGPAVLLALEAGVEEADVAVDVAVEARGLQSCTLGDG